MRSDALADIRESFAPAEGRRSEARTEREDRDMLAGVVGARPGRVIAVVSRQHRYIAGSEHRFQFGNAPVKRFQGGLRSTSVP